MAGEVLAIYLLKCSIPGGRYSDVKVQGGIFDREMVTGLLIGQFLVFMASRNSSGVATVRYVMREL